MNIYLYDIYICYRSIWWNISGKAKDFIVELVDIDPKKRLSATEALRHKWIKHFVKEGGGGPPYVPLVPLP